MRTREGAPEGGRVLTVADESAVVARVRSGEREAYAELVRAGRLPRPPYRRGGGRPEAGPRRRLLDV